ncbi:MAG: hypothetical protein QGM48_10840 [Actinomycetota bacterium]|nr:hypothetical protein [Actinomycetota bacterium]
MLSAISPPCFNANRTSEVSTEFCLLQINPLQQEAKTTGIDLDAIALFVDTGQRLEGASFESLVVEPKASVVEHQELDLVSALVEEDEEVAAERIVTELLTNDPCESVELLPKIHGTTGNEDAQRCRDAQHVSSSTRTSR